jgi:hypothetical protein
VVNKAADSKQQQVIEDVVGGSDSASEMTWGEGVSALTSHDGKLWSSHSWMVVYYAFLNTTDKAVLSVDYDSQTLITKLWMFVISIARLVNK